MTHYSEPVATPMHGKAVSTLRDAILGRYQIPHVTTDAASALS
jgi:hypothetical protein